MTPITTQAEAEKAIGDLAALIERLSGIVEQETVLVRAGELRNASALEPTKAQLAGQLYVAGERLKANASFFRKAMPAGCAALAKMQDSFRAVLQKNMVVLATAHAVSEIEGVEFAVYEISRGLLAERAHKEEIRLSGRLRSLLGR